jgi:prepilin-type N-terminal cleavage/methylation domain-containing protein
MKRAFTMIEVLLAVFIFGLVTTICVRTFQSVVTTWTVSTDYIDKLQRTDYALYQVVSALRSLYYPHDGKQDDKYGFVLTNNGDGETPDESDQIEWSKCGSAIVGNKSVVGDSVHRVRLMILEEGDNDYKEPIQKTGLYARLCSDSALNPKDDEKDSPDDGYGFNNLDLYQPVLIAEGVVGFNCRVIKSVEDVAEKKNSNGENDSSLFEDEFSSSNSVPYKVELTFHMKDPDGKSYRSNTAPLMRIVRIPIHEQSLDGAALPGAENKDTAAGGRRK